jgi:hypothetical protein
VGGCARCGEVQESRPGTAATRSAWLTDCGTTLRPAVHLLGRAITTVSRLGSSDSAVVANVWHPTDQEHDDGEWYAPEHVVEMRVPSSPESDGNVGHAGDCQEEGEAI